MMRHAKLLLGLFYAAAFVLFAMPAGAQVGTTIWTGEYFSNANLAGPASAIIQESSPSHDWGLGSPIGGLPADYFSARWTAVEYLDGTYQVSLRADDGVRFYVDGSLIVNQWQPSPGNTYTANLGVSAGQHTLVIEYFEAGGYAFLQYGLLSVISTPIPTSNPTATVTTNQLNVRNIPNPCTGAVLTRISLGQVYPIVGKNADTSWLQLNVNGTMGWVNATYVSATQLHLVPVTDPGTRPFCTPTTSATATVIAFFLNVRQTPDPVYGAVITRISFGQTYPVIGKNPDVSWLLLNVNGTPGWVRSRFVIATGLENVPVVSSTTQPVPTIATVITPNLNVRAIPDPINGVVLTRISLGQSYQAVGRNASGTWVQLNVNGLIGWVNARYVTVSPNLLTLPVTG
jgi:uncharacterized protein YraI